MRMSASNLLHRKGGRKSSRSGGNACCPIIRVKCSRPHAQASRALSITDRLAKYKRAKAAFKRATGLSGTGPIHPEHEATSLPKSVVERVAHAAANPASKCTVTMGGRKFKGLTGAQAGHKVAQLTRELRRKRCIAVVKK